MLRVKKDLPRGAIAKMRFRQSPKSKESARIISIADVHPDEKRFVVQADQIPTAFLELHALLHRQPERGESVTNMSLDSAEKRLESCCVISWQTRRCVSRHSRVDAYRLTEVHQHENSGRRLATCPSMEWIHLLNTSNVA